MKKITYTLLCGAMMSLFTASFFSSTVSAAACNSSGRFLGMPTWYRGLETNVNGQCTIKKIDKTDDGIRNYIGIIILNITEIIMFLVTYSSIMYLIIGGFRYMTSRGLPDKMEQAKKTIRNAVIGLIVASASIAIVNTIVGVFIK